MFGEVIDAGPEPQLQYTRQLLAWIVTRPGAEINAELAQGLEIPPPHSYQAFPDSALDGSVADL